MLQSASATHLPTYQISKVTWIVKLTFSQVLFLAKTTFDLLHYSQGTKVTKSWPSRISPVWLDPVESSSSITAITTTSWRLAEHRKAKTSIIRYSSPLKMPLLPEL